MNWILLGLGVLFLTSCAIVPSAKEGWFNSGWRYRKKIIIGHKKIPNKDKSNFPVLISLKDADLKNSANGSHIAQPRGEDILFTSSDGRTKLGYEIEKYDPTTGEIKVWVEVPTLSHTKDTQGGFTEKKSWKAYDVGLDSSYQSAGFDGRYIYFAPGSKKSSLMCAMTPRHLLVKNPVGQPFPPIT